MKVCTPHCGIAPESGSGGEVYERELLRDLAGHGVDVHILLARGKPHDRVPGWTVHPVWPPKGLRWPVMPFVMPRAIKRVWDAGRFDLLRAHSVRFIGPAALIARRRYRLPVPVVTHHHHLDPSPLNPHLEKRVLVASDAIVTDSEFAKRQLEDELGIRGDHVRVVYCGVGPKYRPEAKSAELLRRWGLEGRRVLLSLGPLIERKNPFFLLEAFRDVHAALGGAVSLVWVGSGPLRGAVLDRARALGIADAVVLTGYLPEADKVPMLNLADVFVFPSLLEGFPLAPQEAMSCGKPVVAFRVASLGEMIEDGATGFLTAKNDRAAFAERTGRLLSDEPMRAAFGRAAAERVDRYFRWDLTVRSVLKIYQEVVDEARRGR
ncbi:MAG: glycosyltransferase family 4 protein [Candidatus Rokubacteria bacterium]|nr:glycosyltransferase family 4 protein [Candidatus Rokubacteria bacterium]